MSAHWGQLFIGLLLCCGETGAGLGLERPGAVHDPATGPLYNGKSVSEWTSSPDLWNKEVFLILSSVNSSSVWTVTSLWRTMSSSFRAQILPQRVLRDNYLCLWNPIFYFQFIKGRFAQLILSYYCPFSAKNIKFKDLSLISCRNIISLMDVSFWIGARKAKWVLNVIVHSIPCQRYQRWMC